MADGRRLASLRDPQTAELLDRALNSAQSGFVGQVSMTVRSTAPSGWLLCQGETIGSAASGADYAAEKYRTLFDLVKGFSPNTGSEVFDDDDTVTLPDLQGAVPVGYDSADTDFDTLGETGGAKTHTLVTGEIPSHNHSVSDSGHSHGVTDSGHTHGLTHDATQEDGAAKDRIGTGVGTGTYNTESATTGLTVNSGNASISESSVGGGGAHNNVQPYVTLNFVIKYRI